MSILAPVRVDRDRESAQRLLGQLGAFWDERPLEALTKARSLARSTLAEFGVPTFREEDWRHTNLREPLSRDYRLGPGPEREVAVPPPLLADCDRLVFVEGEYRPTLSTLGSLSAGMTLGAMSRVGYPALKTLSRDVETTGQLGALNLAVFVDGALLRLERKVAAPRPIEVLFLDGASEGPRLQGCRLQVELAEGASATLVERHLSLGRHNGLADLSVRIDLEPGARLKHVRVQDIARDAAQLSRTWAGLGSGAAYDARALVLGGGFTRHEVEISLAGRGSECSLTGAVLLGGKQLGDVTTRILHFAPDTKAEENLRFALDGASRGVFQGLIAMDVGASRADGRLAARTLLLSDRATIFAKPELRILHDEVQAAHGATSGKLDEAALFYLRSRGVPLAEARRLLVTAFLLDALEGFDEESSAALRQLVEQRLAEAAP